MNREKREEILWDLHQEATEAQIMPSYITNEVNPVEFGLEPVKAQEMTSGLSVTIAERDVLKNAYLDVIELEINAENLPTFKELRLKIVKNRTQGIEKWHKTNKAFYLAGGRFVDAIKNKEILINEEMEAKLMEAEKYFDNLEKEKKAEINRIRLEQIAPYVGDTFGMDLSEMNEYDFEDFLLGKKTRFEAEIEASKAEAIKIETERLAEIERQKVIKLENDRLKAEAEAKEKTRKERGVKMQPYIVYIRDYNKLLEMSDADFEKEIALIHKGAIDDMKYQAEKLQAEENERAEEAKRKQQEFEKSTEIRLKEELKTKIENDRLAKEKAAKLAVEKLAKADIETQLTAWIETFSLEIPEHLKNDVTANEILTKFLGFKTWANGMIKK